VSIQYEISTTVEILVYVRDGEITGIDVVDGFGEPDVEAVDLDTERRRTVYADNISDWKTTELAQALAPLTGRWRVEVLP
jgi:hypothetical protein